MESDKQGAPPRAALVIIDMQREFLSDEGMFRNPVDAERLLVPLEAMIAAARAAAQPVVWVRSEYPVRADKPAPMRPPRPAGEAFAGVPMNDDHLASGHAGRPCCAPGSPTAELLAPLQALVREGDPLVTKDRYSAFMGTDLDARLRARGVDRLLLCGVVANTCVRATAADAFFLGYAVTAISDCVGATSPRRLRDGLDAIARWYGEVRPSATLLTEARASLTGLGAGDSAIHYGVLSAELAATALDRVRDEVTWRTMHHKGGVVPRGIAIQGTIAGGVEPIYRHPADEQPALAAWTPTADAIRREVSAFLDQPLNHALIQRYADGNSFINPHADKTLDVARGSAIVNLSLGATRTLLLRAKGGGPTLRIHLPHNSLFVLGWETNRGFVHGIRHDRRADSEKREDERVDGGERVSLTMRTIATFRRLSDGRLFGQGARVKREEALADAPPPGDPLGEATAMLEGFGRENRDPDFDWEASYGAGFDALNFQILRDSDDAESEADR
jgi:nicotinamidase-related amidase